LGLTATDLKFLIKDDVLKMWNKYKESVIYFPKNEV
jgi:hypothetical protein